MKTRDKIRFAGVLAVAFLAGILISRLVPAFSSKNQQETLEQGEHQQDAQVWTCSMHPQIRQDHAGQCPLCAMDLIPVNSYGEGDLGEDMELVQLSEQAAALANIQTTAVGFAQPSRELHLYGSVQADERRLQTLVSHFVGRIEALHIRSTGETVRAGQVVATLYSSEWLNAQQELLEAAKVADSQPALLEAAREKLRNRKVTEAQIEAVERSGRAVPLLDLVAETGGSVLAKRIEQGDYVAAGDVLFDLADLSSVWAVFDAYADDLPYLRVGDRIRYTLPAIPGRSFTGRVAFIDPVVDPAARTARVRVETANLQRVLKPGMVADAQVLATLRAAGPMLVAPKSAVLWTGRRSVVYVREMGGEMPAFRLREIELGEAVGSDWVVLSGLREGEEIVSEGAFVVDAAAQLAGKRSMMNRGEAAVVPAGDSPALPEAAAISVKTLLVQGLCGMCRERIESTAKGLAGVSSAAWDSGTKILEVGMDERVVSLDKIAQALAGVGHDAGKHKAPDEVYDGLPGCCGYRE